MKHFCLILLFFKQQKINFNNAQTHNVIEYAYSGGINYLRHITLSIKMGNH